MSKQRIILEMGTGNDLYGEDYSKAAIRAVQDALHHSSITLFRSLNIARDSMMVDVTIGVQEPDKVDLEMVRQQIPYGTVTAGSKFGGLNVVDSEQDTTTVIATAAVEAYIDIEPGRFVSGGNES
jgi:uncharacterized protein (TIGR02058 family)